MKLTVRLLRLIMPIVAISCIVVFVPWAAGCAWLAPLPDTVQEQVDDAIDLGLDGIIVYVDQSGKAPALYSAGWKIKWIRYSNTNYLLIGNILDKTLGYSHHQYINREILVPFGLTHTYGLLSQVNLGDVVSGYYYRYDTDLRKLDYISPGASMVATVQDVGTFLRALNDGSLLDDDEQATYSSIYVYEHTGWLPGYLSIARYHKDIDAVVIQL